MTPKTFFRVFVAAQQCLNVQTAVTLYTECDSIIYRETFITSCKETVRLARSRNISHIYLHMVFYTEKSTLVKLNNK